MSFFTGLYTALSSYGKAFTFIRNNKMGWFFIFPILLNILFYTGGFFALGELSNCIINWLKEWLATEYWHFWGAETIAHSIEFLLWLILKTLSFLLLLLIGGHVVLMLLSPVLAYLSENTEYQLENTEYPFYWKQFLKDILRGIYISLRNLLIELAIIVLCFFIAFIPFIGLLTAPFLFFVTAYYYGFSFLDYNLERKQYTVSQSVSFMKRNKGLAIGNGILYALVLSIPLIGISLAGFIAIFSTVSATLVLHKKKAEEPSISLFKS